MRLFKDYSVHASPMSSQLILFTSTGLLRQCDLRHTADGSAFKSEYLFKLQQNELVSTVLFDKDDQFATSCSHSAFRTSNSAGQVAVTQSASFDVINLLDISQQAGLDFLPIPWHRGMRILGEGATAEVNQSIINAENSFAFKRKSRHANKSDAQLLNALCTEILVLCHPPVRDDDNIISLVGIAWEIVSKPRNVWPNLVFPKAEFGSLDIFLRSERGKELPVTEKLVLCSGIINAVQKLHACGKCIDLGNLLN